MRELKRHGKILDMKYHKFTFKTLPGDPVNLSYCSYGCPIITRLAHTVCVWFGEESVEEIEEDQI